MASQLIQDKQTSHATSTRYSNSYQREIQIWVILLCFNPYEPTYKIPTHEAPRCDWRVQSIECECSKLDINNNFFLGEDLTDCILFHLNLICRHLVLFVQPIKATFSHISSFSPNKLNTDVFYSPTKLKK